MSPSHSVRQLNQQRVNSGRTPWLKRWNPCTIMRHGIYSSYLVKRKHVNRKWVFNKNINVVGQVEKLKARLVAKGYSQVEGVNFGEIFPPIAKLTSIRLLMSLSTAFDLEIEQMDLKTTFLHGYLEE
jgi:hypothetical protein